MNAETITLIRKECEKIEKEPGFGEVIVKIQNGCVKIIQPTSTIKLDRKPKKV